MSRVDLNGIFLDPAPVRLALPRTGEPVAWAADDSITWAAPHIVVTKHAYTAPNGAFKTDLVFFDATTGKCRSKGFAGSFAGPYSSPDDTRVVAGETTLQAFDGSSGKKIASLKGHKNSRVKVVVRRGGYATGSEALVKPLDQTLRFWGLDGSLEQKHKLGYHVLALVGGLEGPLYALLKSSYVEGEEPHRLLTCFGEQGEIRWQSSPLRAHEEQLALSPAGDLLAVADGDSLKLVRAADGEHVRTLSISPMPRWGSTTMFFSPDGRWFGATVQGANFSFVWDVRTGYRVNLLHSGHLAFSGDASRVAGRALHASDGLIHVWEGDYLLEAFQNHAKDPSEW